MRLIMRALSHDPRARATPSFWTVGAGERPPPPARADGPTGRWRCRSALLREGAAAPAGSRGRRSTSALAAVDERPLQAPYRAPSSVLGGTARRPAPLRDPAVRARPRQGLARAGECTLNDIVLYLSGSALRRYLVEHAQLPERPLTAGIPVNLREADDQSMGTAIGIMVAELGTNVANPRERLRAIARSTRRGQAAPQPAAAAGAHLLHAAAQRAVHRGLVLGLGGRAPVPFNVGISNVPGPTEPLYMNGSRLDALFPLSLLTHGNALNITCVSYAGRSTSASPARATRCPTCSASRSTWARRSRRSRGLLGRTARRAKKTPARRR